jgi:MFS family permease
LRDAAEAFRYRNFTLFWSGALLSNTGTWVQNVTVPFVVFQITDSGAWLGFAAFAQLFPAWLMGPLSGVIADRFPRRTVLLVTQSLMALLAFLEAAVWAAGVRSPHVIVGIVALSGFVAGLNIASWQAFVSELVPRDALLNAVTLNSAQFNASRAFGPALGGLVLYGLGPTWAFLINALSYGAVLGALALIRLPRVAPPPGDRPKVFAEFAATVRYTRSMPGIVTCILVVMCLGLFGSPVFTMLVVFADDVFHVGEGLYGVLGAALGLGSILGLPIVAGWGSGLPRSRLIGGALWIYGASLLAFALAPGYWVGVVALLVAGAGYLAIASTLNTTIQLQVDERMRGKVLALYLMGLTATIPLGNLVQGWAVDLIGPRPTVAVAATAFLAVAAVLASRGRLRLMD